MSDLGAQVCFTHEIMRRTQKLSPLAWNGIHDRMFIKFYELSEKTSKNDFYAASNASVFLHSGQ